MSGRNGVQIPNTKSQFCQVAATLCKSIEFFHVDPLTSSFSLCNWQLYPRKIHRTAMSFSPTMQPHASHKLYHQTSACKDESREAPDRAKEGRGHFYKEVSLCGLLSYLASKLPRVYFRTECHFSRWPSLSGTTFHVLSWCQQSDSLSLTKPTPALLLQLC